MFSPFRKKTRIANESSNSKNPLLFSVVGDTLFQRTLLKSLLILLSPNNIYSKAELWLPARPAKVGVLAQTDVTFYASARTKQTAQITSCGDSTLWHCSCFLLSIVEDVVPLIHCQNPDASYHLQVGAVMAWGSHMRRLSNEESGLQAL